MQIGPTEEQTGARASPRGIPVTPFVEQKQQMLVEVTPRCTQRLLPRHLDPGFHETDWTD